MSDREHGDVFSYAFKPSLTGAARHFELDDDGLSFRSGYRAGVWQYADIVGVRLTYRPISMLARRFRADIRHKNGKMLTLISATWASIALVTPRDEPYRAFVSELHKRLQSSGTTIAYAAGLRPVVFAIAAVALGAVMLALAGLLIRALAMGQMTAALFMLGFAAWFGWTIGRWLLLNKPRAYDPDDLPEELLP